MVLGESVYFMEVLGGGLYCMEVHGHRLHEFYMCVWMIGLRNFVLRELLCGQSPLTRWNSLFAYFTTVNISRAFTAVAV